MYRDRESLRNEVLELDEESQAWLAKEMTEHLGRSTVRPEWISEAKRRLAEYRAGKATLIEPSETFAKTKKMISEARRAQG